ncbi:hypothetical protein [Antarcticirhabdus aurantiaca]|uniref:Uncharacterized protein n=1 Tax=Antarcticirhabdus aurantiaca TaxID=2606717 RepID=A0ACD4NIU1_9HYPH|nr:hypothetical protein OXU80_17795 [Jeongeuplla avenae]
MSLNMHRLKNIPFAFSTDECDEEYNKYTELKFESVDGGQRVSWPPIGESLFVSSYKYYPDLKSIEHDNGDRFVRYGTSGFSLGRYHEFLIDPAPFMPHQWEAAEFWVQIGSTAEASFGYATPLMAFLFEGPRPRGQEWPDLATVRIYGPDKAKVEPVIVSAFRAHQRRMGTWPKIFDLDRRVESDEIEIDVDSGYEDQERLGADLDPLRFLNSAMAQPDGTAACMYLYRILEFYAFFATLDKLSSLRHDVSLSDLDFSRRMAEIMFRDEKGPIQRLVQTLADRPLLDAALDLGIITSPTASQLGDALYAFRNSIVHGKYGSGFAMHSDPVIGSLSVSSKWHPILLELANKSIDHFGARG